MIKLKRILAVVYFLAISMTAIAQDSPLPLVRISPDELKWVKSPSGLQVAAIAGDQTKSGVYITQVKFPAGAKVPPHFHPDMRVVTVVSGTVYFGYGEKFDESAMKALPAGSAWTEPARQPHFAWAKDGEAIIQVVGNGPTGNTAIPQ
jgi:quercetin dioxygenase-like cupin family protein